MRRMISNIAWDVSEDDAIAKILREEGITAVELAPTKYWPAPGWPSAADVAEVEARWLDRGQEILALQSLLFGRPELSIFGDAAIRAATTRAIEEVLRIAAGLGARALVFGSPRNRDRGSRSPEEARDEAAAFFRPLARQAADLGCVIGLEPNPAAYACNFATTIQEALDVVNAVDHPGFGLHLDVGIASLNGENLQEEAGRAVHRICHVHVSEPNLAPVPSGAVDHEAAARALRNIGWAGPVSIEMRGGPLDGSNAERVRRALIATREFYGD